MSATRTGAVTNFLRTRLSDQLATVVATDAHLTCATLDQVFIPSRGKPRVALLQEALGEETLVGQKSIVFCNTVRARFRIVFGFEMPLNDE